MATAERWLAKLTGYADWRARYEEASGLGGDFDPATGHFRSMPGPGAWSEVWRDLSAGLIIFGPPVVVPAVVLLVLGVSGWIRAGFEPTDPS